MSLAEKKVNLAVSRRRYALLTTKTQKGLFLDQFCFTTGLDRKHAIKQVRKRSLPAKRGHPRRYDMDSRKLLVKIWRLTDQLCGKLLHAVASRWLESLKRRGTVDPAAEKQVLAMSASTMDRLLRSAKHHCGRGRRRAASLLEHRRQVPLKVDVWPEQTPREAGWIEADTVAHCGGSMAESFIWSVVFTDVATQWTELRCAWNKGAEAVCRRVGEVVALVPFKVKAMFGEGPRRKATKPNPPAMSLLVLSTSRLCSPLRSRTFSLSLSADPCRQVRSINPELRRDLVGTDWILTRGGADGRRKPECGKPFIQTCDERRL